MDEKLKVDAETFCQELAELYPQALAFVLQVNTTDKQYEVLVVGKDGPKVVAYGEYSLGRGVM